MRGLHDRGSKLCARGAVLVEAMEGKSRSWEELPQKPVQGAVCDTP